MKCVGTNGGRDQLQFYDLCVVMRLTTIHTIYTHARMHNHIHFNKAKLLLLSSKPLRQTDLSKDVFACLYARRLWSHIRGWDEWLDWLFLPPCQGFLPVITNHSLCWLLLPTSSFEIVYTLTRISNAFWLVFILCLCLSCSTLMHYPMFLFCF